MEMHNTECGESTDVSEVSVCAICCDNLKTPITLTCGHIFCYLCIKALIKCTREKGGSTTPCPACRVSIPNSIFENAHSDITTLAQHTADYAWMYESRTGGKWWYYQKEHNTEIEERYKLFIKQEEELERDANESEEGSNEYDTIDIEVCAQPYTIDFYAMKQYPKNGIIARNIKRVDKFDLSLSKGVAGMRYVTQK